MKLIDNDAGVCDVKPTDPMGRLVSIQEARMMMGVSRGTVYNWLRQHKVEYVRTAGGRIRIFAATLGRQGNVLFPERTVRQGQ